MTPWTLQTPVILLIFNRPDTTRQVFEAIRQAQPPQLLVIADGPRPERPGEADQCAAARSIIDRVDWDCQVFKHYSDSNLGCRQRVSSGLTWAFNTVEEAIVLEDDCLPHPSFFRFCQELLEKYRDEPRVMSISGDNFQFGQRRTPYSYYFSRYNHIWGWASWRRAWQQYDLSMKAWPKLRSSDWLQNKLQHPQVAQYWSRIFDMAYQGFDTWDYAWLFACWYHEGLIALPEVNLVSNIGFNDQATHTKAKSPFANMPTQELEFPLRHPVTLNAEIQADCYTEKIMFSQVDVKHHQQQETYQGTTHCHICHSTSIPFAAHTVLNKYKIQYFQCSNCGFVQTEEPYWLDEAYSSAIANSDVGLVTRNLGLAQVAQHIILKHFDHNKPFLDYGAGYGLFVRLMRDAGFDFYWHDKYAENLLAKGFDATDDENKREFELVTAFELFEHFTNPLEEIDAILSFSKNILFSTELLPQNNPRPGDWWYYAPLEGQHISIYTRKALEIIAQTRDLNLYSNGKSVHLLTEKTLTPAQANQLFLLDPNLSKLKKPSLLQKDYQQILNQYENATATSQPVPKVIVDGVFFQLYRTGIARVWQSLLEEWAKTDFASHLVVLNRAKTAPIIPNLRYIDTPAYDYKNTAADRQQLQQICNQEQAHLFISSYYTTPLTTPSIFMAYDMIPELVGYNLSNAMWREKRYGIQHASAYLCISQNTAKDLVKFYSNAAEKPIKTTYCGTNQNFYPSTDAELQRFKAQFKITKPYFLISGVRVGYKNTGLFFKAFAQLPNKHNFEIVCTGGGSILEAELQPYARDVTVHMLYLSDDGLRNAYSGATALVFPSQYEGFGLPVLEAMACGCPVITSPTSSLPEVAGNAALYVQPNDVQGMLQALQHIQSPEQRQALKNLGLKQAQSFSWGRMAKEIRSFLTEMAQTESPTPQSTSTSTSIPTLDNPRQLRRHLTQQWLNLPNDQLETHFNS
ncbi:glycosyltransferase, partial [Geitlerinema sp. P-1104]|uniref:glycosyltransferase n=1 Tax=Geitlerinema sp. P-1104 TaxID=2546230 RepID=UPI001476F13E